MPKLRTTSTPGDLIHYCPGCDRMHLINTITPNPHTGAKWSFDGNMESPTFSPSIHIHSTNGETGIRTTTCHYFINQGNIQYLSDCIHKLAGQTIPLPDTEIFLRS